MSAPSQRSGQRAERIQAELEHHSTGPRVRISVEDYDDFRGWCAVGSIDFPLHELPLLEQALDALKANPVPTEAPDRKIIPFPRTTVSRRSHRQLH